MFASATTLRQPPPHLLTATSILTRNAVEFVKATALLLVRGTMTLLAMTVEDAAAFLTITKVNIRTLYGVCCTLVLTGAILLIFKRLQLGVAGIYSRGHPGPFDPSKKHVTPTHSSISRLDSFTHDLRLVLGPVNASLHVWPKVKKHVVVPIILCDGELLFTCHIREIMHRNQPGYVRARMVVEMIRTGLDLVQSEHLLLKLNSDLPVLLMNGDSGGFGIKDNVDVFDFPCVGWSLPSPAKYGHGWCKTIGIPFGGTSHIAPPDLI